MKRILFIISAIVLVSCNSNNQSSNSGIMTEAEYQASRPSGTIDIPTTFEPTLELTDEIKNTSLADLIKQRKGKPSKADQALVDRKLEERGIDINKMDSLRFPIVIEWDAVVYRVAYLTEAAKFYDDVHIKHISASSNLAKVFYLQDLCTFISLNTDYYIKNLWEESEEQKEEREKNAQKNWDKYQ